jgi:hypothetical protein
MAPKSTGNYGVTGFQYGNGPYDRNSKYSNKQPSNSARNAMNNITV